MAIESTFYDTSESVPASLVTEIKWADAHPHVGTTDYGVVGIDDFEVTVHPSTPFTLNVSPGKAWGHGVFDVSDSIQTVTCNPAPAGSSRWDLVAIRRDWGPLAGGPSSLVVVEGGTVEEIPATRANTPGTLDDQPLCLLRWTAGQTQPTMVLDQRCWAANGGMFAKSKHTRSYLNRVGATLQIGDTVAGTMHRWTYELGANDVPGWVYRDITWRTTDVPNTSLGLGWRNVLGQNYQPRVERVGNIVHMFGGLQRRTGELSNILTIPAGFRPVNTAAQYVGSGVTSSGVAYQLVVSGDKLWIPPNYMTRDDTTPDAAYPINATWAII